MQLPIVTSDGTSVFSKDQNNYIISSLYLSFIPSYRMLALHQQFEILVRLRHFQLAQNILAASSTLTVAKSSSE
jgi:hypothetical protein